MGPLDRMFDRDGDGELDAFERASEMDFLDYVNGDGIYKESSSYDDDDDFNDDFDGDEFDSDYDGFDDDF